MMVSNRHHPYTLLTSLVAVLSFAMSISPGSAYSSGSKNNLALYWGQASAGSEESLGYYCEQDAADIFIISFLTQFGSGRDTTLNIASCSTTYDGSSMLYCPDIASDIETCQSKGKLVLLSLGGAAGSYGFDSDSDAESFAETLWNLFGEGDSDTRPFGTVALDGFDFDIEGGSSTGYAALASKLKSDYFTQGSKSYYISAAPQCPYPDSYTGDLLSSASVDFAFIQFYNNYCSVEGTFNWDTWTDYAANTSPNKDIKLFLGLPGASSAAGSGYIDIDTIESTIASISSSDNFGGVMMWDASQAFSNTVDGGESMAVAVQNALDGSSSGSSDSSSDSSSAASSTAASVYSVASVSSLAETTGVALEAQSGTVASTVSSAVSVAPVAATSTTPSLAAVLTSTPDAGVASISIASGGSSTPASVAVVSVTPAAAVTSSSGNYTLTSTIVQYVTQDVSTDTTTVSRAYSSSYGNYSLALGRSSATTKLNNNKDAEAKTAVPTWGSFSNTTTTTATGSSVVPTASLVSTDAVVASDDTTTTVYITTIVVATRTQTSGAGTAQATGSSCSTEGATTCLSGQYAVCDNGSWVLFDCPSGTECEADSDTGAMCAASKKKRGIVDAPVYAHMHRHRF